MSIASMTGFARVNGSMQTAGETINWVWEAKSVNGKSLDVKTRLPAGYDELGFALKSRLGEYLKRGSVSIYLDVSGEKNTKKVKVDEALLERMTSLVLELGDKYAGRLAPSSAADILSQRGVIEFEENVLSEDEQDLLKQKLLSDFVLLCRNLQACRRQEGAKIKQALKQILDHIADVTAQIEETAAGLPVRLKEKLEEQVRQYASDTGVSEDRMAQEIVLLVTRADIREEIDRLKTHIKSAFALLEENGAVGRQLDFLCQELNREANTTCSKAADIAITNCGMELKALIEQFREQVQNIE